MDVTLQPATLADRAFAFRATEETMRRYVEEEFGEWNADFQERRSDTSFDPNTYSMIVVDGSQAGLLVVEDRPEEIFLAKIYVLPRFQRRGIGSSLIRTLINRADTARKPLRLRVLRVNPARALYERLGFVVSRSIEHHHYMEYSPTSRPT